MGRCPSTNCARSSSNLPMAASRRPSLPSPAFPAGSATFRPARPRPGAEPLRPAAARPEPGRTAFSISSIVSRFSYRRRSGNMAINVFPCSKATGLIGRIDMRPIAHAEASTFGALAGARRQNALGPDGKAYGRNSTASPALPASRRSNCSMAGTLPFLPE